MYKEREETEDQIKVDFHLVKNVACTTFSFCLRKSRMEPSRNLFNFNNADVARTIFCTKWKSTLTEGEKLAQIKYEG